MLSGAQRFIGAGGVASMGIGEGQALMSGFTGC